MEERPQSPNRMQIAIRHIGGVDFQTVLMRVVQKHLAQKQFIADVRRRHPNADELGTNAALKAQLDKAPQLNSESARKADQRRRGNKAYDDA